MIYFDNSATTRPDEDVLHAYIETSLECFGNPSSSHRLGVRASMKLQQARYVAASCLGAEPEEIIFTSSGTESNNTALKGVAFRNGSRGKHIITTSVEHASVYETCRDLERMGYSVTYLSTDDKGCVGVEDVREALREDTILVSIMHVNNELGCVQPIEDVGRLLSSYPDVRFHVDAVQSYGKMPLNPKEWGIDVVSLSAHKFHGLRGAGLLYVRRGVSLAPLMNGGGQESDLRSGTENVACLVAMSRAMQKQSHQLEHHTQALLRLKNHLLDGLALIPNCVINSPGRDDHRGVPHILNFSLLGLKSGDVVRALESKEIYVSKSSACSSKSDKPSRVLLAAGMSSERAESALRVSFSVQNTEEEVNRFLLEVQKLVLFITK